MSAPETLWTRRTPVWWSELIVLSGADHFPVIDPRAPEWSIVEKTILDLIGIRL